MALTLIGSASVLGVEPDEWDGLEDLFWECSEPGSTGHAETPRDFARAHGKTDAELAERLMEIIKRGFADGADAVAADQAEGALWHLRGIGEEREFAFIRELLHTTKDMKGRRDVAILVGMEMMPEKWEEWLREVVADERSDNYDRFLVFNEAFQIGRDGDEKTRRRVVEVFEEMKTRGVSDANRRHLDEWIAELEKLP